MLFQSRLAQQEPASDPLVRVLVTKGVLTTEEARGITAAATPAEQRDRLAALLRDKGVISAAEFEAIRTSPAAETQTVKTMTANYKVDRACKTISVTATDTIKSDSGHRSGSAGGN